MRAINFDTLKFAKDLKKAGFTQEQAEGQAKAQLKIFNRLIHKYFATKEDIKNFATREDMLQLGTRMTALEMRVNGLDNKIDTLYLKLLVSLGGIMVAGIGVITFLLKM